MNKLLLSEGGQPLHLDDIAFLQDALSSPIEAIVSSLGNCILAGCGLSSKSDNPAHTLLAEGYIAIGGKVYRVDAKDMGTIRGGAELYWELSSVEGEPKSFDDGEEHNTQRSYKATLISWAGSVLPEGLVPYRSTPRLGDDFLRRPTIQAVYEGAGRLVEFVELSRYSGIITLAFDNSVGLVTNGYFATLDLKRYELNGAVTPIYNTQGKAVQVSNPIGDTIAITLLNGKLTAKRETATEGGGSSSHIAFAHNAKVSFLVSWDYETNNGIGADIAEGTGSSYRGTGRTIYGSYAQSGGSHSRQ